MPTSKNCPKCNANLPPNAPSGICPKCLIGAGLPSQAQRNDGSQLDPTSAAGGFEPPSPSELADQFPHLEILELLGHGGMGAVYKARQTNLDRLVALKILPMELGADPAFAERFSREARALAKLSHQNIVSVFDFGETKGQFYLIMEYVDGANLRNLMEVGDVPAYEALDVIRQICDALQFAHKEGVVHRDIKPENMLVDKMGRVKIADFGLAKLIGNAPTELSLTGTQQVMGTLRYMAPEQMEGAKEVDHRADIFSLGVVFYELLTGELPIGRFDPPSLKRPVDARLDEIVLRALEKEPARRYQQASDVNMDIASITQTPSNPVPSAPVKTAIDLSVQHYSKPAIYGAVWAAFFFIVIPLTFMTFSVRTVGEGEPVDPPWSPIQYSLFFGSMVLVPLGLTAPFGTTILGLVSISQIRRSNRIIVGMPLALTDALLFPLLLIDGLIFAALLALPVPIPTAIVFFIGLVICGIVDFLIIRWAWNSVREESGRQQPNDRGSRTTDRAISTDDSTENWLKSLRWLLFCINLVVLILACTLGPNTEYGLSYRNNFEYVAQLVTKKYLASPSVLIAMTVSLILSFGVYNFVAGTIRNKRT